MSVVSMPPRAVAERQVIQPFLLKAAPDRQDLYWKSARPCAPAKDGIALGRGCTLSLDTYFNSFFESQWRQYTTLDALYVRVELEGKALLRVFRRALGRKTLVLQQQLNAGAVTLPLPGAPVNFRQNGALSIELTATTDGTVVLGGAWLASAPEFRRVALAAIFCTHNREADLGGCLDELAFSLAASSGLAQVIVVNQGKPGLRHAHPVARAAARLDEKLVIIEQANKGGAGGFTRGLLAALDNPDLTHAVLLDDDIQLEPASLARMAMFFAVAKQDLVIGGHMLDLLHPTILYEAGAKVGSRHWAFLPDRHGLDVGRAEALEPLSHPVAVHYNGWWCCGVPLSTLREHGLPLPCFIRGDDVEFGLRLGRLGVPTVPMPGIAVWHAPFYLKLHGWQTYYETRNVLVCASLHLAPTRLGLLRRAGRHVVQHLLTYRYYSAALVLDAVQDYLAGPDVFASDPHPRHLALAGRRTEYPEATVPREQVLDDQPLRPVPRTAVLCLLLMMWLMLRNAIIRDPSGPPRVVPADEVRWIGMRGLHHFVLQSWWDEKRPVLRRSRSRHRSLLWRAVPLLVRLYREGPAAGAAWRRAAPALTSIPFWREYLDVPEPAEPRRHVTAAE